MICALALMCLQIGLGVSHANPQDCGIWYMCGRQYPHALSLNSPSVSVGGESRNWRVGYEYSGRFGSEARAIATIDPTLIPCAPRCYPLSTWHGSGKVEGVYVQYVVHSGPWSAEAGPWVYRTTWEVDIPDYTNYATCSGTHTYLSTTNCNVSTDKTSLGAMFGVGYGPVVLSVRSAEDRGPDRSVIKQLVTNLSFRWRF